MPISVLCPSCDAPVNAPDSAAGKRAKCPKCQELMILPGGAEPEADEALASKRKPRVEVEDEEDRPRKPSRRRDDDDEEDDEPPKRKSSRRVVAEDDGDDERPTRKSRRRDDDEDDDDERPRRKGKSKKKAGPPMGAMIGVGVVLLLLIAGGLYFAFSGGGGSGGGGGGAKVNWVAFNDPEGAFAASFPESAPIPETLESLSQRLGNGQMPNRGPLPTREQLKILGMRMEGWSRAFSGRTYTVFLMTVPPALGGNAKAQVDKFRVQSPGESVLSDTPFTAGRYEGKQILTKEEGKAKWVLGRVGTVGNDNIIFLMVESNRELKADDADAKAFFEKFQWKK